MAINLLPWREQTRQTYLRYWIFALLGPFVIVGIGCMSMHCWIGAQIRASQARQQIMQQKINQLSVQLKPLRVQHQIQQQNAQQMIQFSHWRINQNHLLQFLQQLPSRLPVGTYLISLRQEKQTLQLIGQTKNNREVAVFLQTLSAIPWIDKLQLIRLYKNESTPAIDFEIKVILK